MLKPKQIIFTSDPKVYAGLIKQPYLNTECVKLTTLVDGTYVVDMEKLFDYTNPFNKGGIIK